ncbi:uncharacterized LOC100382812 [Zea mays]|uniref:Uncharacterized protein n=1 Tax=Zea mays TaxID=4577 RepID=C0PAX0_MAIZE|nr:uncharacterized LOC100382812 [Zea mays]ACN31315.1 unknown [Zea mays]|eukprot:NP_001168983.1 uncharacterized LOC100382812 [Zea mays]
MRGEPPGGAWVVLGAGDELQRVPRASQGVQRRVRAAAVPAVDRRRRGAGPRHRLRRQVLRPRRPHVLPHRRPRAAAPSGVPVVDVRGGRADDQPCERRRGAARRGQLAAVPGGGGDGASGRRHRAAARVRRGPRQHVCSGGDGEAGRGVLDVLHGEAGGADEGERGGGASRPAGAVVRPRAVAQPRVVPGAGRAAAAAARHAVHDLRGVRDDDERRRRRWREGARAAEPFCLRL